MTSTTKKEARKSYMDSIRSSVSESSSPVETENSEVSGGVLQKRLESAERSRDKKIERRTLLHVAADRCRIWAGNPRRYDLLDEARCQDLINSIKDDGQKEPATARPLSGDAEYDYEIIIGTRRHWTARHLGVPLIIQVDETLSDEEAFRLADIENRDREDVSDYERAVSYRDALKRYYNDHQGAMASALKKSNAWLSRYLDLADMPKEIVSAYPAIGDIRIEHIRKLKPLLADPKIAGRILDAARSAKGNVKKAAELMTLLVNIAKRRKKSAVRKFEVNTGTNKPLVKAALGKGRLSLTVDIASGASDAEIIKGIRDALAWAKE